MVANTYLEIYTMMFGWNMYEAIWDVLVGTGVALIPFIVAVVSTFKETYSAGNASETIKNMETTLLGMILVLMLCVIPYKSMSTTLSGVRYEVTVQDCGTASNTNTPSSTASGSGTNTQTGFDSAMSDLQTWQVHKPVAWTLVETVSTAITHTSIKSMTCVNNYEFMLMRIANITIQDETLRKDIQNFYEACYKPAVNKYKSNPPLDPVSGNPMVLTNVEPWEDIDWMGSRILLGYANAYYRDTELYVSNYENKGFTRQPTWRESDAAHQTGVYPDCEEGWLGERNAAGWFNAGGDGLRERILDDIPDDEVGDIVDDWKTWGAGVFSKQTEPDEVKEDMILKLILENNHSDLSAATQLDMSNNFDADKGFWSQLWDGATQIGNVLTSANEFLQANAVQQMFKVAGPMLLVMFQMIVVIAAPFVMIFGSYGFSSFFALAVTWFSLEFINAIWAAAYWFDNRILQIYATNAGWFDEMTNSLLIRIISMSSIFLLPMIWLSIMAMAGSSMLRGMGGGGVGGGVAAGSSAFAGGMAGTMRNTRGLLPGRGGNQGGGGRGRR